jgi:hypothetical protein
LCAVASPAPAQDDEAADDRGSMVGAVRLNYYRSTKLLDDVEDTVGATVQVKGLYQFTDRVGGKLEMRAGSGDLIHGSEGGVKVTEAYLDATSKRLDLRLGKQIVAWGRADALNPTDVVTPRDYTVMLPFDEDQRTGIWGLRSDYYVDPDLSLTFFVSPDFAPSRLPLVNGPSHSFVFEEPQRPPYRGQFAARLNSSKGEMDWSVSAFRGYSLFPQAERSEQLPGGASRTLMRYPVITMLGADVAKNFGRFGFRFEGAYIHPENREQQEQIGMKPYLYLVGGADRTFLSNLNVNFQLFGRWMRHGPLWHEFTDPGLRQAARINSLTFVQTHRQTFGYTMRVANTWRNDTLEAELFIQHYFRQGGTYVQPMIRYAVNDAVKLTAGAQWYFGNAESLLGSMKKNRNLFLEMRYSF